MDGTTILTDFSNTLGLGSTARWLVKRSDQPGWYTGHLAELVFFEVILSDADRQKLEGYFAHRYGLVPTCPAGTLILHHHRRLPHQRSRR
jgi:hypothetical protein